MKYSTIIFCSLALYTFSSQSFANSESDQQELVCISKNNLEVNGIPYLGKAKRITDTLGKPKKTRSFMYDSGGNSGRYKLIEMTYDGVIFTANPDKSFSTRIEKIEVSGKNYRIGSEIHVGDSKAKVMQILGIHSEKDTPSIKEAEQLYMGKKITISSAKKRNWAIYACGDDLSNVTTVNFYFDSSEILTKFAVVFDDGSI